MSSEGKKILGRSSALVASLMLHGIVLLGFGYTSCDGSTRPAEPGVMIAFLTIPAPDLDTDAVSRKVSGANAAAKPAVLHREPAVQERSYGIRKQAAFDLIPSAADPPPEHKQLSAFRTDIQEQAENSIHNIERSAGIAPLENQNLAEPISDTEGEPDSDLTALEDRSREKDDSHFGEIIANHKSPITNHQEALLAFAGDPSSLSGIIPEHSTFVFRDARILDLPEPAYPVLSRKRGEEGRVVLEVAVGTKGEVQSAKVERSSSYKRLDRAALAAVKRAAFEPATRYGAPVESVTKVAYRFELEGK